MVEQLQLWIFCEGCRHPHEIGYADLFEKRIPQLMAQSAASNRDDIYFFVKVVHTTDI